jgi:hypothetical protein
MTQILTQDELGEVNTLRNKLMGLVQDVGETALQIELLTEDLDGLKASLVEKRTQYKTLLSEEQALVNRFLEKYGAGSINFETGEFTPEI